MTAADVIAELKLVPLEPEGGYYRETYRSVVDCSPGGIYAGRRSAGTAIFYLLTPNTYSAVHRLPGDEVYHFYLGDPVELILLHPDSSSEAVTLGHDLETMHVQFVVPGGTWQGSSLVSGGAWALMGTSMSPGFDFADFEAGSTELSARYPTRTTQIQRLLP